MQRTLPERKGDKQAEEQWLARPFPQDHGVRGWRAFIIIRSRNGSARARGGTVEESSLHLEGARKHIRYRLPGGSGAIHP